jgi:hypothetical protein
VGLGDGSDFRSRILGRGCCVSTYVATGSPVFQLFCCVSTYVAFGTNENSCSVICCSGNWLVVQIGSVLCTGRLCGVLVLHPSMLLDEACTLFIGSKYAKWQ